MERCGRCGAAQPRVLTRDEIDDLAADVLEAPSRLAAQDLLAGMDVFTAARVGVALATLVRICDRARLPLKVDALRASAAGWREIDELHELWQLPTESEPS